LPFQRSIHDELWSLAVEVARETPTPTRPSTSPPSTKLIDLHTQRVQHRIGHPGSAGHRARFVPGSQFTMVLIGIHGSYSRKRNLLALV